MGAHRRYGILCLVAPVCWTLTIVLVLLSAAAGLFAALLGVSQVLTPSPTGEQDVQSALAVLTAFAVGSAALALVTLVLDVIVTVMSLRRIVGTSRDRAVPVLSLLAIGVSTAVPALLIGLALTAGALEQQDLATGAWWLLGVIVLALAPWTRAAQLIGGIVETASPASRPPDVARLP